MFNFNNDEHADALDKAIADLLEELDNMTGSDENYTATADNLVKLMKIKNETSKLVQDNQLDVDKLDYEKDKFMYEKAKYLSWKPSPDALTSAAASVLGIVLVLHYEKVGVIATKALGFIQKLK